MFWINPRYRSQLQSAGLADYESAAALRPTDDYVKKQGRSTARYRIDVAGETLSVYVKKHMRLPWWQRILAPATSFPGPHEYAGLKIAASLGINVPEPIFAGARRDVRCASLLAVRELEGYLPLHVYIPGPLARLPARQRGRRKRAIIARLVDFARKLHGARYFHRDFYLCHFFIREDAAAPDGFDLALIDFGRLLRSRLTRWRTKDLAALYFSSDLAGITATDRLRFFKRYLGLKKLDEPARRLLRRVLAKGDFYRRHNYGAAA